MCDDNATGDKMTSIIYVVNAFGGQWEDAWATNVCAFYDAKDAERFIEECEAEDEAWLKKADRIIDEFEGQNVRTFDITLQKDMHGCSYEVDIIELHMTEETHDE